MPTAIVQTETAAAGDQVLGAGVAHETGETTGGPPGGAGAFALVDLEEPVELVSENNSVTTVIVQAETAAAGVLAWGAGSLGQIVRLAQRLAI